MTVHHVVAGVDGSLPAVRALDRAALEAERRGAGLRIVYAVTDHDEAAPILESAATRIHDRYPLLTVTTRAVQDGAAKALVRESEGAALTVIGTRGFAGFTGLVLGSVSLRVAADVHSPLLVVRGDHAREEKGEVLLGLEGDDDTEAAAYAFEEAERRGVWLRVLHAHGHGHPAPEPPSAPSAAGTGPLRGTPEAAGAGQAAPRFRLARLQERHPKVGVDARTVRSAPVQPLVDATREAALVVIGVHRHGGRPGPWLGPVAHALLHRSHCPVLLVPTAG
jgi:nucleotide-binding universal stress UspA family protein